jgi:hypothetical protein
MHTLNNVPSLCQAYISRVTLSYSIGTIVWIPSHVGITANKHKQVDKLAKLGTTKPTATTINSDIELYANQRDIQQEIDQQIEEEWQAKYISSRTGKHYKTIEEHVSKKIEFSSSCRDKETLITRLRLGKCNLNSYLQQLQLHPTGLCDHCGKPETIQHFLIDCTHADIFTGKKPTVKQALTEQDNIDRIYNRVKEMKRRL